MPPATDVANLFPPTRLTPLWTNSAPCPTVNPMSKTAAKPPGPDLPFEEALQKLESIVESMETDDLPLETLIARFEEGTRLTKVCQAKLAEAELKIKQLEKNSAGELSVKPLDLADEA
jgi:exodeoxyribonuclease VII small subunit